MSGGATTEHTEYTERFGEHLRFGIQRTPLNRVHIHSEPKQERVLDEGTEPFSVFRIFRGHLILMVRERSG